MRIGIVTAVLLVAILYWCLRASEDPRSASTRGRASSAQHTSVVDDLIRRSVEQFEDEDALFDDESEWVESRVLLTGDVSDEQNRVLADVIVMLGSYVTVTDQYGRFELEVPRSVAHGRATIQHAHYRKQRRILSHEMSNDIVLVAGGHVAGVVKLADGAPAEGILVTCRWNSARTDRDGLFRLGGLHMGERAIVECAAAASELSTIVGDEDIEFRLETSTILLDAVDAKGEPVRGARYRVDSEEGSESGGSESGGRPWDTRVALKIPVGKPFRVIVMHDDYLPVRVNVQPLADRPIQDRLTIPLERAELFSVPIHVAFPKRLTEFFLPVVFVDHLDEEGVLLLRRIVRLRGGRAIVKGLPAGAVRLRVSPRYAPLLSVTKRAMASDGDQEPIHFQLPQGHHVEVLWPWTAKHGGTLELRRAGTREFACNFEAPQGLRAWYTRTWVPPGSYEVCLKRGADIVRRVHVTISASDDADDSPSIDWRKKPS